MTGPELTAVLPLIVLAAAPVAVMLAIAWRRHHGWCAGLALAGLLGSAAALPAAAALAPLDVTPLFRVDAFALVCTGLVLAAAAVTVLLSWAYFAGEPEPEEHYVLLLLATLGAAVLVSSRHFASLILGLELLSVALFALIAYPLATDRALEAGIKYLVLASVSASFLLFGAALVYAASGTLSFAAVDLAPPDRLVWLAGVGLLLVGLGFKLGLVPFHMWTPDVYQGAPVPVTAFVASVSKGAVYALLLRFLAAAHLVGDAHVAGVLTLVALASMFGGNLLALLQDNVKRLLAYSSIAQLGYLLAMGVAASAAAVPAGVYYLGAYLVSILGAFGVVTVLSAPRAEAESLAAYRGLAWRRPWLAAVFTASLLSLAGIPLTGGFVGKFYLVAAGVESDLWLLVGALLANSAISVFYYARLVFVLYAGRGEQAAPAPSLRVASRLALSAVAVALVWLGLYPEPLVRLVRASAAGLGAASP